MRKLVEWCRSISELICSVWKCVREYDVYFLALLVSLICVVTDFLVYVYLLVFSITFAVFAISIVAVVLSGPTSQ